MGNGGTCDCCRRWAGRRWRVWDETTDEMVWLCNACEREIAERRGWRGATQRHGRSMPRDVLGLPDAHGEGSRQNHDSV